MQPLQVQTLPEPGRHRGRRLAGRTGLQRPRVPGDRKQPPKPRLGLQINKVLGPCALKFSSQTRSGRHPGLVCGAGTPEIHLSPDHSSIVALPPPATVSHLPVFYQVFSRRRACMYQVPTRSVVHLLCSSQPPPSGAGDQRRAPLSLSEDCSQKIQENAILICILTNIQVSCFIFCMILSAFYGEIPYNCFACVH